MPLQSGGFGLLSHRAWDLRILASAVKKQSKIYRALSSMHAVHKRIFLRIIRCTLSHWQPHRRKLRLLVRIRFQSTSRGSSRPPTSNAAFWLRVSNIAVLERSHQPHYSQNAFDSALLAWYERAYYSDHLIRMILGRQSRHIFSMLDTKKRIEEKKRSQPWELLVWLLYTTAASP